MFCAFKSAQKNSDKLQQTCFYKPAKYLKHDQKRDQSYNKLVFTNLPNISNMIKSVITKLQQTCFYKPAKYLKHDQKRDHKGTTNLFLRTGGSTSNLMAWAPPNLAIRSQNLAPSSKILKASSFLNKFHVFLRKV